MPRVAGCSVLGRREQSSDVAAAQVRAPSGRLRRGTLQRSAAGNQIQDCDFAEGLTLSKIRAPRNSPNLGSEARRLGGSTARPREEERLQKIWEIGFHAGAATLRRGGGSGSGNGSGNGRVLVLLLPNPPSPHHHHHHHQHHHQHAATVWGHNRHRYERSSLQRPFACARNRCASFGSTDVAPHRDITMAPPLLLLLLLRQAQTKLRPATTLHACFRPRE